MEDAFLSLKERFLPQEPRRTSEDLSSLDHASFSRWDLPKGKWPSVCRDPICFCDSNYVGNHVWYHGHSLVETEWLAVFDVQCLLLRHLDSVSKNRSFCESGISQELWWYSTRNFCDGVTEFHSILQHQGRRLETKFDLADSKFFLYFSGFWMVKCLQQPTL